MNVCFLYCLIARTWLSYINSCFYFSTTGYLPHQGIQGNPGKIREMHFALKNIREKLENSTNSGDNQRNVREIVSLLLQ